MHVMMMKPGENPNGENTNRRKSKHFYMLGENPNIVYSKSEKTPTFKNIIFNFINNLYCFEIVKFEFIQTAINIQHTYKISDLRWFLFLIATRRSVTLDPP